MLPLAVCLVVSRFPTALTRTDAALVLVLLVLAAASTGLRGPGLVAALAAAVGYDFFLTRPFLDLAIVDRSDVETTVLLLVIGVVVTELALWGRRQQDRGSRQYGYLVGVLDTAAALADDTPAPVMAERVAARIAEVLGADRCRYSAEVPADRPVLGSDGVVRSSGQALDVSRDGLPTDDEIVLPAGAEGCFLITAATHVRKPGLDERRVAVALAEQAGAALVHDRIGRRGSAGSVASDGMVGSGRGSAVLDARGSSVR